MDMKIIRSVFFAVVMLFVSSKSWCTQELELQEIRGPYNNTLCYNIKLEMGNTIWESITDVKTGKPIKFEISELESCADAKTGEPVGFKFEVKCEIFDKITTMKIEELVFNLMEDSLGCCAFPGGYPTPILEGLKEQLGRQQSLRKITFTQKESLPKIGRLTVENLGVLQEYLPEVSMEIVEISEEARAEEHSSAKVAIDETPIDKTPCEKSSLRYRGSNRKI